jgi:hypothetical protein
MFSSIMEAGKKPIVLTSTGRSGHATASTEQAYAHWPGTLVHNVQHVTG